MSTLVLDLIYSFKIYATAVKRIYSGLFASLGFKFPRIHYLESSSFTG
jgi:hypothetical protein